MIRLVVISDSPPTVTEYFDQPTVTIGCANSPFADLPLSEENLNDRHIQIILENHQFYALNLANDPFATVNGKPFGKKNLNSNDLIQIGNAVIRLELKIETPVVSPPINTILNSKERETEITENKEREEIKEKNVKINIEKLEELEKFEDEKVEESGKSEGEERNLSSMVDTKELLPIILEKKLADFAETLEEAPNAPFTFDLTYEEEQFYLAPQNNIFYEDYLDIEEAASTDEFSDLIHQEQPSQDSLAPKLSQQIPHPLAESFAITTVNTLKESPPPHPTPSVPQTSSTVPKLSLKDYYLSEYDDVGEPNSPTMDGSSSTLPKILLSFQNWIVYLKVIGIFAILALIAMSLVYLWMTDQGDKDEITASKAVADIAMALTYAQIKNIHPQNQNWSDPEFIRNNLIAVLPSKYFSHADFDTHGQFHNCPYFLRIYTSGDLSQFLVIAQPAPSLHQWIIPKSTIIVDSHAMEMRKTKDLKSLNRLLVNANTLDGTSAVEVSYLVRQGTLIPLASLVNETENIGFSPPKALALMRPGAENLVYNAPRYFPLSEELMKKSLDLIEKPASNHEVIRLQQELAALKKLPDAVLYVSGGIQNAIHAQKALVTLSPQEKFLIAYLQINNKGQVANSHLLVDDSIQEAAIAESKSLHPHPSGLMQFSENIIEPKAFAENSPTESLESANAQPSASEIDEDNPLLLQFSALNVFRQQALRSTSEEIISLLNQQNHASQKNFELSIKQLITKYIETDNEQQAKIQRKLDGIYRENTHVAASQFFHLAKIAGVRQPLMDYIDHLKKNLVTPEFTQERLDKHLQKIEKASNWQNFEQEVAELVEILNLERIPDEETIVSFQNAARSRIIQKLNQFILSPTQPQVIQAFDSEYRYTLIHILKMSWITDPDTYDFYLNEFDLRTLPRGSALNDDKEDEEEL